MITIERGDYQPLFWQASKTVAAICPQFAPGSFKEPAISSKELALSSEELLHSSEKFRHSSEESGISSEEFPISFEEFAYSSEEFVISSEELPASFKEFRTSSKETANFLMFCAYSYTTLDKKKRKLPGKSWRGKKALVLFEGVTGEPYLCFDDMAFANQVAVLSAPQNKKVFEFIKLVLEGMRLIKIEKGNWLETTIRMGKGLANGRR